MAATGFHALLLTFPAVGHVNPMLQLASRLLSRGCSVTVFDTQRSHKDVLLAAQRIARVSADFIRTDQSPEQASLNFSRTEKSPDQAPVGPCIRYLTISDGLPDSFKLDMAESALIDILDSIKRQRGLLEKHIESSKSSDNPISCIISDSFFSWAMDLAASAELPGVICLTSNPCLMVFASLQRSPKWTREAVERDEIVELHNLGISKDKILARFDVPQDNVMSDVRKNFIDGLFKASQILVNSFQELERYWLNSASSLISKVRFVGPLLPAELLEAKTSGDVFALSSGSREDSEYKRWLDVQSNSSVLFISFGSVATLPSAQLGEIAEGIEESGLTFLWTLRPSNEAGENHLPDGFQERTKDRGRVIPWADQLGVLNHPATGGFLTHCGWNSVVESIFMGVPMLCLPAFAEQPVNRDVIINQWKVGTSLHNSEGKVTRELVTKAARELMDGIEGKAMRERVVALQKAARQAISEGGSSSVALTEFIDFARKQQIPS